MSAFEQDKRPSKTGILEQDPVKPEIVGASEQPVKLVGRAEHVPVTIDARAHTETLAKQRVAAPRRILLHLEDIQAERNPAKGYGVYVNLPEDPDQVQLREHHVGNLSLFGVEQARKPDDDRPSHGLRSSMDITEVAHTLEKQGDWDGRHLRVTLRPLVLAPSGTEQEPPMHEDLPVSVGRVSVSYA
jgi:tyrosinase